jgi:hypothetical protein
MHKSAFSPIPEYQYFEMYTTPKSSQMKRFSNGAPKKTQFGAAKFDNMSGILRHTYRINESASKVVTLYLDPKFGFVPTITIGRPGEAGVRFGREQLTDLFREKEKANGFFLNGAPANDVEFPSGLRVRYDASWEKMKLIKFTTLAKLAVSEEDQKQFVAINADTWNTLMNSETLIFHVMEQLHWYQPDAQKVYDAMINLVRKEFNDHSGPPDVKMLFLKTYNLNWLQMDAMQPFFDVPKCYFEIVTNCQAKLYKDLMV